MATTRAKRRSAGARASASAAPRGKKPRASAPRARARYHLVKSEPESRVVRGREVKFSVDDLLREPGATAHWDGVRNYEARNCMRRMRVGDLAFFYHSNCRRAQPGVVGVVEVVREAYPDHTAWDEDDPHYDAKSPEDKPRWDMVDVRLVRRFARTVTLDAIKSNAKLAQMQLVKRSRISVQDVSDEEWQLVLQMAQDMEK